MDADRDPDAAPGAVADDARPRIPERPGAAALASRGLALATADERIGCGADDAFDVRRLEPRRMTLRLEELRIGAVAAERDDRAQQSGHERPADDDQLARAGGGRHGCALPVAPLGAARSSSQST